MTTSISICYSAVIKEILAQSALRHVLRNDVPGLLCRDQEPALRQLLESVLARIVLEAGIDSYEEQPSDPDIFHIELQGSLPNPSLFRALIEQAAAYSVMASAYASADPKAASHYSRMSDASAKVARQILLASSPASITPQAF